MESVLKTKTKTVIARVIIVIIQKFRERSWNCEQERDNKISLNRMSI